MPAAMPPSTVDAPRVAQPDPPTVSAHRNPRLNPRQKAFVAQYLLDRNATQAAIRAGYSQRSARQTGCDLLTVPAVAAQIAALEAEALHSAGLSLAQTLTTLRRCLVFDARKLYHDDGTPKALSELDDDTAACIEGIESRDEWGIRDGERVVTGRVHKYKIAGRIRAVELAMRHFGAFAKENEQQGKAAAGAVTALLAQMRGSTLPVAASVEDGEGSDA